MTGINIRYEWVEELPQDCPPTEAVPPNNDAYFRLVNIPVSSQDFDSHRRLFPKKFFRVSECVARSTSLFSNLSACVEMRKFPLHRGKKLVRLILPPDSGLVMSTGEKDDHLSWWRATGFDPIGAVIIVNESALR